MSERSRRLWRWAVIGMTAYSAGYTIWLSASGDWRHDLGLIAVGAAITITGILALTLGQKVE